MKKISLKTKVMPRQIFNQPLQHAHMHALTRLLQEKHSITFIEKDLCYKLGSISEKLYRFHTPFKELTSEEQELWLSFDIGDITFFIYGQQECTLDYTHYLRGIPSNLNQAVGPLPPFRIGQVLLFLLMLLLQLTLPYSLRAWLIWFRIHLSIHNQALPLQINTSILLPALPII